MSDANLWELKTFVVKVKLDDTENSCLVKEFWDARIGEQKDIESRRLQLGTNG